VHFQAVLHDNSVGRQADHNGAVVVLARHRVRGGGTDGQDPKTHSEQQSNLLSHHLASRLAARRAMRAATYPPLNPLSMLTTTTLADQALSIVRSGATPWNAAPYPMLVGTAMTGQSTTPPTTLGKAPSMPATTTIASAPMNWSRCRNRRW